MKKAIFFIFIFASLSPPGTHGTLRRRSTNTVYITDATRFLQGR
jgi:hypothetical protein